MSGIFVSIFIVTFCWWFYIRTRRPKNFPSGPPRWPIIGSLPYVSGKQGNLLLGLRDLIKRYGPIVGFYIGNTPVVLIADYGVLKTITKLDATSYRPSISPLHFYTEGWETMKDAGVENEGRPPGIVFSNGSYWREQRRFLSRNLKNFGFGKSSLESLIDEELVKLCNYYRKESNEGSQPISLMQPLKQVIISILWTILFGEQRDLEDPKLAEVIRIVDEALRFTAPQSLLAMILPSPSMASWPILKNIIRLDMLEKMRDSANPFIHSFLSEHQKTFDKNHIRGFVDQQLLEIENTKDPTSCFFGKKGYYALFNTVMDIFLAGQDTTSSSVLWAILYILHHPQVQTKIHKELDEVLGRGRRPGLKDRDQLHYMNAVILESHRAIGHVPLGVVREAMSDVQAGSFTIPKGSTIHSGLYFIMNDEVHFKNPEIFNPERFLDPITGKFIPNDRVIPFGLGKRNCLGQSLGEQEFYIFFAGIMSMFEVHQVPGTELPSYDIEISFPGGMVRSAPVYDVILKPRIENF